MSIARSAARADAYGRKLTNKFYNMFAIVDIASQQFKVEAGMDIFVTYK